jgi:hypothetical protein
MAVEYRAVNSDKETDVPNDPLNKPPLAADNPAVMAHITLLQGIINRLANNSASCKTWCLTLVGALVSLAGATRVPGIITFALVPVVIFGFMDTMYLTQEKAYRELYKRTVETIRAGSYTKQNVYEARAEISFRLFLSAIRSWAICPVYLGLIGAYLVARFEGWLQVLTAPAK